MKHDHSFCSAKEKTDIMNHLRSSIHQISTWFTSGQFLWRLRFLFHSRQTWKTSPISQTISMIFQHSTAWNRNHTRPQALLVEDVLQILPWMISLMRIQYIVEVRCVDFSKPQKHTQGLQHSHRPDHHTGPKIQNALIMMAEDCFLRAEVRRWSDWEKSKCWRMTLHLPSTVFQVSRLQTPINSPSSILNSLGTKPHIPQRGKHLETDIVAQYCCNHWHDSVSH